jgi:putative endonuclease
VPERRAPARAWHVYIVSARDGSLYSGVTTDVARRLGEHAAGRRGARYLRGRSPLEVVYQRRVGERGLALRVEWRLKRRSRAEKQEIVSRRPTRRSLLRVLGIVPPRGERG